MTSLGRLSGRYAIAATPPQLRSQDPVVVVIGRMQQGDRRWCRAHVPSIAGRELPEGDTVARDLRLRVGTSDEADLDLGGAAYHDRSIRQGVRADRRQHE